MDVNSYSCEIRLDDSVKLLKNGDKENTRERETGFGLQPRRVLKDNKLQAQKGYPTNKNPKEEPSLRHEVVTADINTYYQNQKVRSCVVSSI